MKTLLTLSMVLGTIVMLNQPAQAGWLFGDNCCSKTSCCKPTCCSSCCSSSGLFGYHGGGVWW